MASKFADPLGKALKTALVTGAGRGIGRHIAATLGSAGWQVGVTARSSDQIAETASTIVQAGGTALAVPGDVTNPDDVERVASAVEVEFGTIDVLVNAAGIWAVSQSPIAEAEVDAWWRVVEVNLRGPMLFARRVLPGMIEQNEGYIISINSLAGSDARSARRFSSSYSVSKTGLFRLTQLIAAELVDNNVFALDISPGLVRTSLTESGAFTNVPDHLWTDISRSSDAVLAILAGKLDALSGRCIDMANDDLDVLAERADRIIERDARVLGLRFYGDDDPLLPRYQGTPSSPVEAAGRPGDG